MGAVIDKDGIRTYYDDDGNILSQELINAGLDITPLNNEPKDYVIGTDGQKYVFDRGFFNKSNKEKRQLRNRIRHGNTYDSLNKYEQEFLYPKNYGDAGVYRDTDGRPIDEHIRPSGDYMIGVNGERKDFGYPGTYNWEAVPNVNLNYPVTRSQYAVNPSPSITTTTDPSEDRAKALMQLIMQGKLGTGNAARLAEAQKRGYSDLEYEYARKLVNDYFKKKRK